MEFVTQFLLLDIILLEISILFFNSRLLPGSVPNLNLVFHRVDVKEEIVDPGISFLW